MIGQAWGVNLGSYGFSFSLSFLFSTLDHSATAPTPLVALSNLVRTHHCHNFNFRAAQHCFKVFKGRFRISRKPPISKFLSPPSNFSAFQNWMIKVFETQLERLKKKTWPVESGPGWVALPAEPRSNRTLAIGASSMKLNRLLP